MRTAIRTYIILLMAFLLAGPLTLQAITQQKSQSDSLFQEQIYKLGKGASDVRDREQIYMNIKKVFPVNESAERQKAYASMQAKLWSLGNTYEMGKKPPKC